MTTEGVLVPPWGHDHHRNAGNRGSRQRKPGGPSITALFRSWRDGCIIGLLFLAISSQSGVEPPQCTAVPHASFTHHASAKPQ